MPPPLYVVFIPSHRLKGRLHLRCAVVLVQRSAGGNGPLYIHDTIKQKHSENANLPTT